jgi:acetoin utilization protein AcuC
MLDNPPFRGMYEASLLYTGGTLTAGRLIARGEAQIAFNPSGGLHHAMRDRASGFCIFDDAAVAIKELLKQYNRIVYLDIDAHHGDGVQSEFYRSSRVMTISQHESGQYLFPGSGSVEEMGAGEGFGYAVNIPVPPDTDDEIHLWAFKEIAPPLITQYNPDLIVFQMGADAHYQDPLTQLNVTTAAYQEMFQTVISMQKPILALGGGGYHMPAVPRIWTLAFAAFLGCDLSDEIPEWYQEKYGIHTLRDHNGPKLRSSEKLEIWNQVRQTVDEIKRKVFPIHQLK